MKAGRARRSVEEAKKRILWNASHYEFTIYDDYYFSHLLSYLSSKFDIYEGKSPLDLDYLKSFDIVVFNYPEKVFTTKEVRKVLRYVQSGGKVIIAAYYNDEDGVASVCNKLTSNFGIHFNIDGIKNSEGSYLVSAETVRLHLDSNEAELKLPELNLYFPCTCSLFLSEKAFPILSSEGHYCAAASIKGEGCLIALGTCVFWDNFSILREDNKKFVNWLFGYF